MKVVWKTGDRLSMKKRCVLYLFFTSEAKAVGSLFYASGSIGGEAVSFVRIKSDNGFDQSDCADRDQVFGIFFGILIFLITCATSLRLRSIRMCFASRSPSVYFRI